MLTFRGITLADHTGVIVMWIGFVIYVVGFACPFWTEYSGFNIGLWLMCSERECKAISIISSLFEGSGWWSAVQCFQCIGLVCLLGACGHATLAILVRPRWLRRHASRHGHRHCIQASAVVGGMSGLLANVIFGAELRSGNRLFTDMSWACPVSITGCVLAIIASIIMTVFSCIEGSVCDETSNTNGAAQMPQERLESETTQMPFHIVVQEVESRNVWAHDQMSTRL